MNVHLPQIGPEAIIALAGDWHGNVAHAEHSIYTAANSGASVLIQLGDFGVWPGSKGQHYLDAVSTAARTAGLDVYFLDGNHEDFDQLYAVDIDEITGLRNMRPGVIHLPRGSRWEWEGLRFCALGGATSLDRGARQVGLSWWPQEAITATQAATVVDEGTTDVLLTHDCPEGVTIPGIDRLSSLRRWPETELRAAWGHRELLAEIVSALTPTHIFHGHFHQDYETTCVLHTAGVTAVRGLADDTAGLDSSLLMVRLSDLKQVSANNR